ncbi:MAG: hypothetical protein HZC02_00875 [Candidatus Levybacteria bacterium]|nr:hypothetical protein [Candidatus Levybacteria bacterium]
MREMVVKHAKKKSFHGLAASSFVAGIFWALGVTIGFSIFIAILSLLSQYLTYIPFIGPFISGFLNFLLSFNNAVR